MSARPYAPGDPVVVVTSGMGSRSGVVNATVAAVGRRWITLTPITLGPFDKHTAAADGSITYRTGHGVGQVVLWHADTYEAQQADTAERSRLDAELSALGLVFNRISLETWPTEQMRAVVRAVREALP